MNKSFLCLAALVIPVFLPAQQIVATQRLQRRANPSVHKFQPIVFRINTKPDYDLRPKIKQHALQVKAQGGRNTCSVFAVNFCFEYLWATQKGFGMGADFSEEYLNYVKNVACNIKKDGGFFSEIDKGYQAWGCYMSGLVPYKPSYDPNYKVPQVYMDVAKKWARAKPDFIKAWNPNMGASAAQIQKACDYLKQGILGYDKDSKKLRHQLQSLTRTAGSAGRNAKKILQAARDVN